MKKYLSLMLFLALFYCSQNSYSQGAQVPHNESTGEITQEKIVITGKSKSVSFNLIREFLAKQYPNYREIVQVEDVNFGQIILNRIEPIYSGRFRAFSFTVTIDVRDDKYRCVIDNVKVKDGGSSLFSGFSISYDMINRYTKEIEDLEYQKLGVKKRRELAELDEKLNTKISFRNDYYQAHKMMALQFDIIQLGIKDSVLPAKAVSKTSDFK